MLFQLFTAIQVLLSLALFSQARTVTLDYNNNAVSFAGQWTLSPDKQPYARTTDLGASMSITLPNGTVSVNYVGRKRKGGSAYGVCVDCVGNAGDFQALDGHSSTLTDDNAAPPVILFTIDNLDPATTHTLDIYNLPDDRFAKTSELTFDNIIASINDGSGNGAPGVTRTASHSATAAATATTKSTSTTALLIATTTSDPSETGTDGTASPSGANGESDHASSSTGSGGRKPLMAVIAIFFVFSFLSAAIGFGLRWRKGRKGQRQRLPDLEKDPDNNSHTPSKISSPIFGPTVEAKTEDGDIPVRPKNPFEDVYQSTVPLEDGVTLGVPASSTLMQKRKIPVPRTFSTHLPWVSRRLA